MSEPTTTLLLLRHGEVASHKGDVPVTESGRAHALLTGKAIATAFNEPITVLFGGTRRTRETAESLMEGLARPDQVTGPIDSFALRNPDIYVSGARVNMVSSAEALAEQVPGMTVEDAAAHPWFREFFTASDRIGWWLRQPNPPGENVDALATRIKDFALSLADAGPTRDRLVIGITHSPVLRAVIRSGTGADPGEPEYVTGAVLRVASGFVSIAPHNPLVQEEEDGTRP